MKIFELTIDELDEWSGMDGLALVESPAIESNFYAFNTKQIEDFIAFETIKHAVKELFVDKRPGESKEDYVSRCIPVLIGEGYDQDQAAAICYDSFKLNEDDIYEIKIGDYQTRHYDMCPAASALYSKIESQEIDTDMGLAIRSAKLQDALFWLEKHTVKEMKSASFDDVVAAQNLAYEIMELAKMMGLEEEHSYIAGHVQAITDLYRSQQELDIDVSGLPDYTNEASGSYQFESYSDYPKQATENAKIALRWAEENGWGDCGTAVGKARANQLAKGEPISEDTVARMSAFARHRRNGQKELGDGCGRLMWLSWGGDAGVDWAQRKLKQIREEQKAVSFSKEGHFKFSLEEDQRRITGALAIPEKLIMRVNPETNEVYYVYFSKETIRQLAYKFMKNKYMDNVNLEHNPDDKVDATLEESWIVTDPKNDKSKLYGLDLPEGSWAVQYKINSDKVWDMIKSGEVKGLSLEGYFSDKYVQG